MAVTFDGNDATLDLELSDDQLAAKPFLNEKYPQLWSGIRANSSASGGKLFFTVKVVGHLSDDGAQPECLIGVSTRSTAVSQLGSGNSWAYASSGHKWTGSKSESFATAFTVGDRIGCLLDLENETGSLSFTHNGKWLGAAFDVPQPDSSQNRLFPHLLLKDLEVEVNFIGDDLEVGKNWPAKASEYVSWTTGLKQDHASPPNVSKAKSSCEVMVMVGLPGCGKSTWASRYIANHPEKHYAVHSVDGIIKQLRLGTIQSRGKPKPADAKTQQLAEQVYKELLNHIKDVPRNYVIDDSNVYADARSDMVTQFRQAGFKTRAAVIVLPDSSLFRRQRKQHQEEGKSVPETTIADMRANFSMPEIGEVFQEVFFVEAKPPEANEIAAAQAEAAKAALPMLKARSSGGRQTRSRTAKLTPTRASTGSKTDSKKSTDTGEASTAPNGTAATDAKKTLAEELQPKPAIEMVAEPAAVAEAADSAATEAPKAKAVAKDSVKTSAQPQHSTAENKAATDGQQPSAADSKNGVVSMDLDAVKDESSAHQAAGPIAAVISNEAAGEEAVTAGDAVMADADDSAAAAADEIIQAESIQEAPKREQPAHSKQETDKAEPTKEDEAVAAEPMGEEEEQAEPMETDSAQGAEQAKVAEQIKPEQPIQAQTEEFKADATIQAKAEPEIKAEEAAASKPSAAQAAAPKPSAVQAAASNPSTAQAAAPKQPAAKAITEKQRKQDSDADKKQEVAHQEKGSEAAAADAQKSARDAPAAAGDAPTSAGDAPVTAAPESRGVKRPAAAVARGAKQARTNQAAGRLLGNIRNQGTVKRTVIKGRVGAPRPGMRLPPPMSSAPDGAAPSKEAGAAEAADKDKSATAGKNQDDQAANGFEDVMQNLLPDEKADKAAAKKTEPAKDGTPKAASDKDKLDTKQPPRTSSTAKASTPKHQDQVTTKPAGPKSGEKGRQDRDRARGNNQPSSKPHQASRAGHRTLPPPISGHHGSGKQASRDRPANQNLGPRNGGVQKVRGQPSRHEPQRDRAPRHGAAPPAPRHQAASRPGVRAAPGRPGRPVPAGTGRPAPGWERFAPPPRDAPPPARLPPPMARPDRRPQAASVPRDSAGRNHRAPPARAPIRGSGISNNGIVVGRRAGPQTGRQPSGPPHTAPRGPPTRARTDRPAPGPNNRRVSAPNVPPPAAYDDRAGFSSGVRVGQAIPRHNEPSRRVIDIGGPSNPAAPRGSNVRVAPPQVFSPPAVGRHQQHPADYRSPAPPVQLPAPRMGPLPGGAPPAAGAGYGPRDAPGRNSTGHVDRSRSRTREAAPTPRAHPYADRPAPRGRQPAAQQLRSATYPQAQAPPQQYHTAELAPVPAHYDQPAAGYDPHARRAPAGGDRYGPGPAARGPPSQRWQNSPAQAQDIAPGPAYQAQREPAPRDNFPRQEYGQNRAPDQRTNRRNDRAPRDRSNPRQQPVDHGRYAQGHGQQEYAPGLAPDGYRPRDAPPPSRGHAYPEDQGYMPPQQHSQAPPSRYDSQAGGYAPPVAQDPHQPVYGSGPVAPQGYTSNPQPPVERQPYYPQQHQSARPAPTQQHQQQYAEAPAQYSEPAYASGPASYAGAPQGGYSTNPTAQSSRGGYAQHAQQAPVSAPRHRGEEYDPAYPGHGRAPAYDTQSRPAQNVAAGQGGGHGGARGGARGVAPPQQWAPSPRETSYGGQPHGSGSYGGQPSQRQGGYAPNQAGYGSSRAPQEMYPPQQQAGSGRMHAPQSNYGRG